MFPNQYCVPLGIVTTLKKSFLCCAELKATNILAVALSLSSFSIIQRNTLEAARNKFGNLTVNLFRKHFIIFGQPCNTIRNGSRASSSNRRSLVRPFLGTVVVPLPTSSGDGAEPTPRRRRLVVLLGDCSPSPRRRRSRNPVLVLVGESLSV